MSLSLGNTGRPATPMFIVAYLAIDNNTRRKTDDSIAQILTEATGEQCAENEIRNIRISAAKYHAQLKKRDVSLYHHDIEVKVREAENERVSRFQGQLQ